MFRPTAMHTNTVIVTAVLRVDQLAGAELRVVLGVEHDQRHDDDRDDRTPCPAGNRELVDHALSASGCPNSPCGRNTRIRIRIENTSEVVHCSPGACQERPSLNAWINPMMRAPSVAPVRLPMPPRTAAVKANSPIWPRS